MTNNELQRLWTPVSKRDTTPEAAAVYHNWWRSLTESERLDWWLTRRATLREVRQEQIRREHPGISDQEVIALWTEQTYRDSLAPEFLAKALAAIRAYEPPPG